ncbi:12199_t:CDS:2, partial [Ambispora leptoticha]
MSDHSSHGDSDGPGTNFHAPLSHSIPKLKPFGTAKNCARCGKKFSLIRPKYHCKNCGNVVCHRCSENRVELLKFGYLNGPTRVCDLCCQALRISSMSRNELCVLPVKTLREFIAAFDLPSKNIIEKNDIIDIIMLHRPMPDRNE